MADEKLGACTPILVTDTKLPDDVLRQVERIGMDLIRETERAEKAERERDAIRSDLNRLAAACGVENPPGPPDLPERVRSDAEELAAFRWLAGWLNGDDARLISVCMGSLRTHYSNSLPVDECEDTPAALATALDPSWRKAGSKEQDT